MASIKQTLTLQDKMSRVLVNMTKTMDSTLRMMKQVKGANFDETFNEAAQSAAQARSSLDQYNKELEELNKQNNKASSSSGGLSRAIRGVISAYTALKVMETADTLASNQARLDLIKREGESVDDLTAKIYASAQASRAGYTDTMASVTKLGLTAKDAFSSTDEIIRFSELMNKNFVIGGASATEQASAMYQLTQAMSSGRLQGDEYRSIIENAPLLAKSIENYMRNVQGATGSMKDWASEGLLTSDVIKAALFSAADETEERFNKMPMTFAQAWTSFKNSALRAFEPVFKLFTKLLQAMTPVFDFLAENQYIFYVIAGAAAALGIAYLIMNAGAIAASISQWALNSAMLACPITWIIIAIAALVGVLIYLWNTNDEVAYGMLWAWDMFLIGLQTFGLGFKAMWYGLLDFLGYFKIGALAIIDGFVNGAVLLINGFIEMLNKIPGVSIDTISWRSTLATDAATEFAKEKAERDADLADDANALVQKTLELERTREERVANRNKIGTSDNDSILKSVMGTDSTGAAALNTTTGDNLLSDEDVKLLLDVATRDYKLNYQSMTPNITMTFGDIRETADVDDIMDVLADRIEEVYASDLEVVQ